MTIDDAMLTAYWLGDLDPGERSAVERRLATEPDIQAQLAEVGAGLELLAGSAPPVLVNPRLRARVLSSLRPETRLDGFASRLQAFFELTAASTRALLDDIALAPAEPWRATPLSGVFMLPVNAGPGLAGFEASVVYLATGANVPAHEHLGEERMLILDGYARESGGRFVAPGDTVVSAPGSRHDFDIQVDTPCLFAQALGGGLKFLTT